MVEKRLVYIFINLLQLLSLAEKSIKIFSYQDVPAPNLIQYPNIEIICKDYEHFVDTNLLKVTWADDSVFHIQLVDIAGYDPVIENIEFTLVNPEPVSIALLGIGALLARRKRA